MPAVRKVRSDKKREVQPTIPFTLYECINRISYVTNQPVKDVGEAICKKGLDSKRVIDYLSQYFRRDYWASEYTLLRGVLQRTPYCSKRDKLLKKRMSIRFNQPFYDRLSELAFALDMTVSSTTALLLQASVTRTDVVNQYIGSYIKGQVDHSRFKQLKEIVKYINENNPYEEKITLSMIINYLVGEVMESTKDVKRVVNQWIDEHWTTN
jgi:hypothetical protein